MHTQLSSTNLISNLSTGRRGIFFQYFVLFISLIFCIAGYGLKHLYGFSMYPDEFGYWASAAANIGYDWSQVASLGSYYAFGYSLILTPILFIFKGGVVAYRVAVIVNALMQILSLFLLRGIVKTIYPKMPKIDAIYSIGISVFYPVWSFFVQITLTEALLSFLYILVVYLMARFFNKPSFLGALACFVPLAYMYTVHMRTVGVIGAFVIVFIVWASTYPKARKFIIIMLVGVIVAGAGAVALKAIVQGRVYSGVSKDVLGQNDYSGQLYTIKMLFTKNGMLGLIQGVIGKIWYLGLSSFGTFYIAIGYMVKQSWFLIKNIRRKKQVPVKRFICLFVLISFTAQFLITAAYVNIVTKLDSICYGRYNEYILPVIMVLGLRRIMRYKHVFLYAIGVTVASIPMCVVVIKYSLSTGLNNMHEYFVAGISYLWNIPKFDIVSDYIKSCVFGCALVFLLVTIIYFTRKRGHYTQLFNVFLLIEVILAIVLSTKSTYVSGDVDRVDSRVSRYINESANEEAAVWYISEVPERCIIDLIQFNLKDRTVNVISASQVEEKCKAGDFIITDHDSQLNDDYKNRYSLKESTYWFRLYNKKD